MQRSTIPRTAPHRRRAVPREVAVTIQGTPGENITIKAIAVASGTDKAVSAATFTYQILDKLAAPTSSVPDGAVFTSESVVELTAETGKIYYTTNGDGSYHRKQSV